MGKVEESNLWAYIPLVNETSRSDRTHEIIGCALAVHQELGPGLLESSMPIRLTPPHTTGSDMAHEMFCALSQPRWISV